MAGLDPAIPLTKARPCHAIGIAGSSPAMTAGGSSHLNTLEPIFAVHPYCVICSDAGLPLSKMRISM